MKRCTRCRRKLGSCNRSGICLRCRFQRRRRCTQCGRPISWKGATGLCYTCARNARPLDAQRRPVDPTPEEIAQRAADIRAANLAAKRRAAYSGRRAHEGVDVCRLVPWGKRMIGLV